MEKREIISLILNDNDLECAKVTLTELNLSHTSFNLELLEKFELIVYKGKKGTKILKSNFFNKGKVV